MGTVLARSLTGKSIIGTDGTVFGTLYTVSANADSGTLQNLVVEPREQGSSAPVSTGTDSSGRLLVPVSQVKTVSDQIVIHPEPV
ncbi:PRC-barrel domain-containing protein [Natronococcus wangiae]|uniref:PRC-barrel domain-containing protein n=1 Tax=Natronococcus wangiae TaxID=3068275 RepID=UPI00273E612E|nr:PRC-barrel domain-containing protein [Natronococcus sp. AD5]